ncbi:MAG TPA: acetyltransferase [Candidatus Wallbacteria bacterium]|nr:acetyltransferase [Candidatus Wallbacteria bacterium]
MINKFKIILKKFINLFSARHKNCVVGYKSEIYDCARIFNGHKAPSKIRIGDYTHIRGELLLFGHGGAIQIGDYCYVGENTKIWSGASIKIGDRVLISHNCNIFDNDTHPIDHAARHEQFKAIITTGHPGVINLNDRPVVIENDVLIGANSTILKGVTIGCRSIIGAGSVVTGNIPADVIAAGNPARIIKKINE